MTPFEYFLMLVADAMGSRRWWYRMVYLKSRHWKRTRHAAITRAGRRCEECHQLAWRIDVHHLTYERLGHERPEDLQVLCRECHDKKHPR